MNEETHFAQSEEYLAAIKEADEIWAAREPDPPEPRSNEEPEEEEK